jgi:hypothetical protein
MERLDRITIDMLAAIHTMYAIGGMALADQLRYDLPIHP